MIKIALVEDEEGYTEQFKQLTERYRLETAQEVQLSCFDNGMDFLEGYSNYANYDIVFMDIEMPHIDGFETAKKLRKIDNDVPLVFVTVMAQLAIKGYEVAAMDFIVKPISYFNFKMKIEKAISLNKRNRGLVLKLIDDNGDSQFIMSSQKGEFHRHINISELEEKLEPHQFIRSNNSYIVNPAYVTNVGDNGVTVQGVQLPIARARKKQFMEKLTAYFKYLC
jgi:DNA-binding LytR/AlgR family response regulator